MRFCDLFISYKIGLKDIKSTISFTKLPLYRKIFIIILSVLLSLSLIFLFLNQCFYFHVSVTLVIFLVIVFYIIMYRKRDIKKILKNSYIPYSIKRMNIVIRILQEYNIDINDIDSLNMLMDEAKLEQIKCDYLLSFKKPIKTLGAIIVAIVSFLANKMSDVAKPSEIIYINIQILIIVSIIYFLIIALSPFLKDFLYRDYNKYDEFIDDLRQIKLFYSKKNCLISIISKNPPVSFDLLKNKNNSFKNKKNFLNN